jgi:hypothetical protein
MTVNKEESKEKPKRTANKRKIKELARPRFDMRSRRQDVRTEEAKKTETVKKTEEAEIGKLNVRFMRQRKEMSVVSPSFDLNCGKVDRKGSLLRSRNARSLSQHRQIRPLGKPSMSQVLEKEGS